MALRRIDVITWSGETLYCTVSPIFLSIRIGGSGIVTARKINKLAHVKDTNCSGLCCVRPARRLSYGLTNTRRTHEASSVQGRCLFAYCTSSVIEGTSISGCRVYNCAGDAVAHESICMYEGCVCLSHGQERYHVFVGPVDMGY